MKSLLIIIDALRYDHRQMFKDLDLNEHKHFIATSNWTVPSLTAMLTGYEPREANTGIKSGEMHGKPTYKQINKDTVRQRFNKMTVFVEIPQVMRIEPDLVNNGKAQDPNLVWELTEMNFEDTLTKAQEYIDNDMNENEFVFIHLKGGHAPYCYTQEGDLKKLEYEPKPYKEELRALAPALTKFVLDNKEKFTYMVVASDHGEVLKDTAVFQTDGWMGHGGQFNEALLHVPVWSNRQIPDGLYGNDQIFNLLMGNEPTTSDFVISSNPSFKPMTRFGITRLKNNKVITKEYDYE